MRASGSGPLYYEMRVRELLDVDRLRWFDGTKIRQEEDGTTTLCGSAADMAALYGLIARARDLGLTLISVVSERQETTR